MTVHLSQTVINIITLSHTGTRAELQSDGVSVVNLDLVPIAVHHSAEDGLAGDVQVCWWCFRAGKVLVSHRDLCEDNRHVTDKSRTTDTMFSIIISYSFKTVVYLLVHLPADQKVSGSIPHRGRFFFFTLRQEGRYILMTCIPHGSSATIKTTTTGYSLFSVGALDMWRQ